MLGHCVRFDNAQRVIPLEWVDCLEEARESDSLPPPTEKLAHRELESVKFHVGPESAPKRTALAGGVGVPPQIFRLLDHKANELVTVLIEKLLGVRYNPPDLAPSILWEV